MAKTILKLDEYLNCAMEINDAILEVFHNKKNKLLRSYWTYFPIQGNSLLVRHFQAIIPQN